MGSIDNVAVRFILDSGADVTLISEALVQQLSRQGTTIKQIAKEVTIKGVHAEPTSISIVSLPCELCNAQVVLDMAVSDDIVHYVNLGRHCQALHEFISIA